MRIVVGQGEAEEQGVHAEDFFEIVHDGDRAAFAQKDGFIAEGGFQRAQRRLGLPARRRNQIRFRAVAGLNFNCARWEGKS